MHRHLEPTLWIGLMLGASYIDFRHRTVPGWLNLCIAAYSSLRLRNGTLAGVLCAIPFPLAAGYWGRVGGGDIKFMAACDMYLGMYGGPKAAILGTASLLAFHTGYLLWCSWKAIRSPTSYPMAPFLTVGCLAVLCAGG